MKSKFKFATFAKANFPSVYLPPARPKPPFNKATDFTRDTPGLFVYLTPVTKRVSKTKRGIKTSVKFNSYSSSPPGTAIINFFHPVYGWHMVTQCNPEHIYLESEA